jgi:hypothetical protein
MDVEAQTLEMIQEIRQDPHCQGLPIKEIAERFIARHSEDFERKITPHWVGCIIRRKLGLRTERRRGGYFIAASENTKLASPCEKYGITSETPAAGAGRSPAISGVATPGDCGLGEPAGGFG